MRHICAKVLCGLLLVAICPLSAGVIGTWSGSNRSLNNPDMATTKSMLVAQGNTVLPNSGMSAADLAPMNVFWIGEASAAPSAGEITSLSTWINTGGILMVFFDSSCGGCSGGNPILSGIGTTLSASGTAVVAPFAGGNFATTGGPYNLVGELLNTTPGTAIDPGAQGTLLAGSYLGYQALGSGHVFAFADRSDHEFFAPSTSNTNGRLFLNIVSGANGNPDTVPEPSTFVFVGLGLAAVGWLRRR